MIGAFYRNQELLSSEFGTLLYDLLPKGVYKEFTCTIADPPSMSSTDTTLTITGGTYLLEATNVDSRYIIRLELEEDEPLSINLTGSTSQFLFMTYTYTTDTAALPSLALSSRMDDRLNKGYILLGKCLHTGYGWEFDTTCSDMKGQGQSYPSPVISKLDYDPRIGNLTVDFWGYFQGTDRPKTLSSLSITKSQYDISNWNCAIYADPTTGLPALMRVDEDTNYLDRTIYAYKPAGGNFVVYPWPRKGEVTAGALAINAPSGMRADSAGDLSNPSATKGTPALDSIWTDSSMRVQNGYNLSNGTANYVAVLEKVVQRLVLEVQQLRTEMNTIYSEFKNYKTNTDSWRSNFSVDNLTVNKKLNFKSGATADFSGATMQVGNATLGSRTAPIETLYVSGVLYAEDISLLSRS